MTELDALTQKAVQDTFRASRTLADQIFWKTLQLVCIIFAFIVVTLIIRRLLAKNSPERAGS
jgi:uncharacterized membrane protein YjfL (UPF0719 family)